jgi:hypothetical protein
VAELTQREMASMGAKALNAKLTPEQRSANATKAINIRWERYRAKVAESRRAQGLDPTVSDDHVLGDLAAQVLAGGEHDGR